MSVIPELRQLAAEMPIHIDRLDLALQGVAGQMLQLEAAGLTRAAVHWRSDRYLVLIHPMRLRARRREYVGSDRAKIEEALLRVKRAAEHERLQQQLSQLNATAEAGLLAMRDAVAVLQAQ